MYINERIKDIEDIQNGITVEHVVLYDKIRIFSCDWPARQFECGQQRGGHYSCIVEWKQGTIPIFYVLGKYCQCLLMIVKIWVFFGRKVSQETYILLEIKKKELDEELEARSIEITDETKPNL